MSKTIRITLEMTVREVNAKYPGCREVFNRHGMGGCGGQFGPPEPINFFAKAHNVSVDELIADLKAAAAFGAEGARETDDEKLSGKMYKWFVKAALIFTLTLGTVWGVWNLTIIALSRSFEAPNYSAIQSHGHAQTFGWVGLFIMGVAYYTIPKFKGANLRFLKIAVGTLPLMMIGIIMRAIAQPLATNPVYGFMGFAASIAEIIAIGIFVALMLDVVCRSEQAIEFYEKYIYAGLVWFLVVGGLNISATFYLWGTHSDIIPPIYNLRILHTQVFGFIANIILGVSLRTLPNFMGLRQPLEKPANAAFWLYNAAVTLRVIGVEPFAMSAALELAGAALFVYSLGVFTKPVAAVEIEGVDNSYTRFVRLGYFWLLITGIMVLGGDIYQLLTGNLPPHAYIGAYRHAITVGFISTLMMGVAYRVLPIFNGTQLYSSRAMRISFWFLAIGNLFRVGWQLGTLSGSTVAFAGAGLSGYLELTAMVIFSWNIVKTLRETQDTFLEDHVVTPATHVADILDIYPQARSVLIDAGFSHMAAIPRPPRFVTLEFAANRHGVDPEEIAEKLNRIIHRKEAVA
ncbi:MAG: NnrS family protein [Armatimonadetes bacterium]|nr:NnrS family protein [Armatimonadota bacterium]